MDRCSFGSKLMNMGSDLVIMSQEFGLKTKRIVIGHVMVCSGCCCGAVSRGKPEVPVDWLKQEWKSRGLLKNIQLSISGCLGPCDLPNVVKISVPGFEAWLGQIQRPDQYSSLVKWACESKAIGWLLPLPDEFEKQRFDPFRVSAG
jgi:cobaltochelatase CobN